MTRATTGKRFWTAIIALLLAGALAGSAAANVTTYLTSPLQVKATRPAYDNSVITVKFKPAISEQRIRAIAQAMGGRIVRESLYWPGLRHVSVPRGATVASTVAAYRTRLDVEYAEPTTIHWVQMVPNDPRYGEQWHFPLIHMEQAWDIEPGGKSTTIVCVADTGVAYEDYSDAGGTYIVAPDLAGLSFVSPSDPANGDAHANDDHGHGTHVTGTIAQQTNNSIGVAGMAYNVSIMPVKVFVAEGYGMDIWIADGFRWGADNGANIINYSGGGPDSTTLHDAVIYATNLGVLMAVAAGNDGTPYLEYPGAYPECVGVAALNRNKELAYYSNWGTTLDVSAPGGEQFFDGDPGGVLQNTFEGSPTNMGYYFFQGTSMATPHVAGLAALIWSQGYPDAAAVRTQIESTCEDLGGAGWDEQFGWGMIDAEAALQAGAGDKPPGPPSAVNAFDTPGDNGGSITVTWRRSSDDGAGQNDVAGYEVWRGSTNDPTTGNFAKAPGSDLGPGSSSFKDQDSAIVNGVNYYYYVTCHDAANTVRSTNVAGPVAARDDLPPPAISTLAARDTPADNGRSITLTWAGYATTEGLKSFKVYRAEAAFTDVTAEGVALVIQTNDPNARSHIDKAPAHPRNSPPLDQVDYWYAVTANDEAGNEITAVTTAGPVRAAPNLNITFSSGLRMITVPAIPVDPSPMAVFAITDPTQMMFARWDSPTNKYHTLADNPDDPVLDIGPGAGFWLNRSLPSYISGGGTVIVKGRHEVAIDQGWSMVGSPYNADCLFVTIDVKDPYGTTEDITASRNVRNYGWRYDPVARTYRLMSPILPGGEETLPALEAMWIYAYQPGLKLVFRNLAGAAVQVPERPPLDGWQVRLVARTRNAADTENFIGVTSTAASLGKVVSPPPMRGGVDLYLMTGARGADRLAMDLRPSLPAGATWNLAVECSAANTEVELSWPDLTPLPHDLRPILTDLATGRSVYMRTMTGYRYESGQAGKTRRFQITMPGATAGPVMTQVAATPTRAGGAEVIYTLHRPAANVQITVLNLAGRPVASLGPLTGAAGVNRTVWNGLSATGQRVPAGRYVVRVTATAENGEGASALASLTLGN